MRARRRGTKRLDLSTLREALKDTRVWASMGVVIKPDGEEGATHWEIVVDDAGNATDIVVEVNLVPANIEVTARLNMLGVVQVPEVGDEVLVVFPDGQLDWMPVIAARMSSGAVPYPSSALIHDTRPKPTSILIVPPPGGHVYIYDGDTGTVEPLVKRSEFVGHTHKVPVLTAGDQSYAPGVAAGPDTSGAATITGTTVLLAK
jgi:hypothetical protein